MPTLKRRRRAGAVARKTSRQDWSRHVEASTLALDPARDKRAQAAFRNLPVADQARLAFEVASTRRRELCLAYTNVVMVTAGRKQKRTRSGKEQLKKSVCVIFVVRRKTSAKPGNESAKLQALPTFLLAYWTVGEDRILCAVPTDVISERRFHGATAEVMGGVEVNDRFARRFAGNIACIVEVARKNKPAEDMILSCLHVFTPVPQVNTSPPGGAPIHTMHFPDQPALGKSIAIGGALWWDNDLPDVAHSFDAQLATIGDRVRLKRALDGYGLSKAAPAMDAATFYPPAIAGTAFTFLVSPHDPLNPGNSQARTVTAEYVHDHPPESAIDYARLFTGNAEVSGWIHPGWALNFMFLGETTREGDSGSPVVVLADDGGFTFVGMHIGRTSDGLAVVIPAWELFRAERYSPQPLALRPVNA